MGNKIYVSPTGSVKGLYMDIIRQTHTLIGGCTGSGKSVVIHGIINALLYSLPTEKQMILVDPKRVELSRYKGLPHTLAIATEKSESNNLLRALNRLMDKRFMEMDAEGRTLFEGSDIYLLIDELADFLDGNKDGVASLKRVLRLGRASKIRVIAATQSPNRKVLPADLTLNFTSQLALRCRSAIESRQIVGVKGAEMLPRYGKGLYYTPDLMEVKLVDIPMIEGSEIDRLVNHWMKQN